MMSVSRMLFTGAKLGSTPTSAGREICLRSFTVWINLLELSARPATIRLSEPFARREVRYRLSFKPFVPKPELVCPAYLGMVVHPRLAKRGVLLPVPLSNADIIRHQSLHDLCSGAGNGGDGSTLKEGKGGGGVCGGGCRTLIG